MTKLFASDFDGTLYFHGAAEPLRQADLEAIRAFQAEGGLFGACTGRPLRGLTMQTEGVFPFDFYIALTGATVFDRDLNPIVTSSLPRDVVRELYERYAPYGREGIALPVAADNYWLVGRKAWKDFPLAAVDSFSDLPDPLQGMSLETATVEEAADLANEVNTTYADIAYAFVNQASIDILPAGHSKGTGLRRAAEWFGATLTAGMGDSFNDVPLLEAADLSYSFHRCDAEVRAAATVLVNYASEAIADFGSRPVPPSPTGPSC